MRDYTNGRAITTLAVKTLLLINSLVISAMPQATSQQPAVVQAAATIYPHIAATARAEGTVTVEVQIDKNGTVISATAVDGHKLLSKAAENGAQRWVFAPAGEQTGIRVVRLTFVFKILSKDTPSDKLLPVFMPPYRVEVRTTVPELIFTPSVDPPMSRQPSRLRKKKS